MLHPVMFFGQKIDNLVENKTFQKIDLVKIITFRSHFQETPDIKMSFRGYKYCKCTTLLNLFLLHFGMLINLKLHTTINMIPHLLYRSMR